MNTIKRLLAAHPILFTFLAIIMVLDLSGVANRIMPGNRFVSASIPIAGYFLGIAVLLRFVIVRRRIHVVLAAVAAVALYIGWFIIHVAMKLPDYKPSLFFIICFVAAFRIMRFQMQPETAASLPAATAQED